MLQHCQLRSVSRISYCDFAFFGRLFYIYSDGKTRFAYSDNIFTPWSSHDELNVVCSKKSITPLRLNNRWWKDLFTPLDLIIYGGKTSKTMARWLVVGKGKRYSMDQLMCVQAGSYTVLLKNTHIDTHMVDACASWLVYYLTPSQN